jgi:hypothetical protein
MCSRNAVYVLVLYSLPYLYWLAIFEENRSQVLHTSEKLYKTQLGAQIARCGKGQAIACDIRLQTLQRTVSEAKSLFNKSKS